MENATGQVYSVNDSLVGVNNIRGSITNGEVAYIHTEDHKRLKAEVIEVKSGGLVYLQVFEDTTWIKAGDITSFTGIPLSVKLGPGILGTVTDGLQNPLYELVKKDWFLERGLEVDPLDYSRKWHFTPSVSKGDIVSGGSVIGVVPEKMIQHRIFVPFNLSSKYVVQQVVQEGEYNIMEDICTIQDHFGDSLNLQMAFDWPIKKPMPFHIRSVPAKPMSTGIRILDALFPIAFGGTACNPGPFGAGKTVLQHSLARHSQADIVIIAACGERAGEAVEIFKDFPNLVDPRTGNSLMDRTYIVGNTSSMPVAAREASIYLATTVGEYYRKQGLNVLILADSTSRWAQALRETSGRKEEIPGPEAFPMYITTLISALYDRAGLEALPDGSDGSLTIIGTVSPAGGNFDEPVTQATLMSTGAFWGLSRALSDARKYPAIDRIDSHSKYPSILNPEAVSDILELLREGKTIASNLVLMGEKGINQESYVIYQKAELIDAVFLQQNSYHEVDGVTTPDRLLQMYELVHEMSRTPVSIKGKEEIRSHFNFLRQAWIDWNAMRSDDIEFGRQRSKILNLIKQGMHAKENLS